MAIPQINKEDIVKALKYIDENGIPDKNKSTIYQLVTEDGKEYPPKYVIAVADHLANGGDISTNGFNAVEAKEFLKNKGFKIKAKNEFVLTITADDVVSNDSRFTMDNLFFGDNYKPIDAYFEKADGTIIKREHNKGEKKISNQTLPRIACQVFEKQIDELPELEKKQFPVCQYGPNYEIIKGIYSNEDEFRKYRKTIEYLVYKCENGKQLVLYCWNIFTTIIFVQECLKRFGSEGDKFVLIYRDKFEKELYNEENMEEDNNDFPKHKNQYSSLLIESKNIILRGAPGTGKTYLAKEIATDIVSNGCVDDYKKLNDEQKQQIEFVQFHPSYDYTDFVEGLRPRFNNDGSVGFELQDGIFKAFVDKARKNYENSKKPIDAIEKEIPIQKAIDEFFSNIELGVDKFKTKRGSEFIITGIEYDRIYISIPSNLKANNILLSRDKLEKMLESNFDFELNDIKEFFKYARRMQEHSYYLALYKEIKELCSKNKILPTDVKKEQLKNYVFIIDEINRGEISKIFGELFFAIDPGYRGENGSVKTQYANLHISSDERFYIPENVYIIGTMNDIDKSIDSFDFAMRRRFRFINLKANERLEMLDSLSDNIKGEAIQRMTSLNNAIVDIDDLNENYQIGASYFLKLQTLSFDQLWTDYLKPLLQEYIQGMYDEKNIMKKFEQAYGYKEKDLGDANEDGLHQ